MYRPLHTSLYALLFACLLALMPYAGVHAAPITQQQSTTTYRGIVNTTANIRSGPGLQYAVVDQAQRGTSLTVVACNEDCSWFQLDSGNWIAAFLVDLVGVSTSEPDESSESNGSGNPNGTNGTRTRSRIIDPDDLVLNQPSEAALAIVERILSYTGLPQTFELYSANIYNAAALMANGQRVILYDPQLIADIENVTDHDWPAVSILAHEIGHHLAGHTLADSYIREFELEADYFSGFILQKMGATLPEAQSVMSLLRDHPNMTDHPPQAERLAAIEAGWNEAARQSGLAAWAPDFPNFAEEAAANAGVNALPGDQLPEEQMTILAVLQQAQAKQLVAEDGVTMNTARDWSLGLRALAP